MCVSSFSRDWGRGRRMRGQANMKSARADTAFDASDTHAHRTRTSLQDTARGHTIDTKDNGMPRRSVFMPNFNLSSLWRALFVNNTHRPTDSILACTHPQKVAENASTPLATITIARAPFARLANQTTKSKLRDAKHRGKPAHSGAGDKVIN